MKKESQSIGIVGLGRMGRCLVQGLIEAGHFSKNQIYFTTKHEETAKRVASELGINACKSNAELVGKSDLVILAVKPQNVSDVLEELKKTTTKNKTFISIIASISTEFIESKLPKGTAVIRVMPNTPAFVGAGMTAFCLGKNCALETAEQTKKLFSPLGRVVKVDERHMDAVTGLSGCGPAYVYLILEALTDGGIKVGLPRDLATELAAQTVLGAAKMLLETGRHPAALKDEVTTPAGCTIDGLLELEEGKVRVTLIKAVVQATKRATELGRS